MKFCDLHTHSSCSDGSDSPEELIGIAEKAGLHAVALCDHNTVCGLDRFIEAAKGSSIIAIPAIEISCGYLGREVHIIGMFLKKESYDLISAFVGELTERKDESYRILANRLTEAGFFVSYDEAKEKTGGGILNRVHFANVLVDKGYASCVQDAFSRFLSSKIGYYPEPDRSDAFEVIEFLTEIKALPILAHPFLNFTYDELTEFLPQAKKRGLIAIEAIYTKFSVDETNMAEELARRFALEISGGSDYHGKNKPDTMIGHGRGNISIPFEIYENLRHIADKL